MIRKYKCSCGNKYEWDDQDIDVFGCCADCVIPEPEEDKTIVTLSVKSGKGKKSKSEDVDKTIDLLTRLDTALSKKLKGFKSEARACRDGTIVEWFREC